MSRETTVTPAVPAAAAARPPFVAAALLVAVASFQLNATMLAPAVGDMARELGTDLSTIGLSSTVFTMVAALAGLFWPPLSDIIGRRRALLLSLGIMAAGSLLSTLATNIPLLMAGRALQGACGATFSLAFLMLRELLDGRRFGRYLGIITAVNAGIGGFDTLLGGVMSDTLGFRSIFALTLVLELLAILLIRLWAPESLAGTASRMDWAGIGALTVALLGLNGGLTLAFTPGGWTSSATWTCFAAAAGAVVVFILVEKRSAHPMLPLEAFRDRGVWGTLLTTFFTMASNFAVLIFLVPVLSLDAAHGFGLSATGSALLFLVPYSVLGWITAPIAGSLAPRWGYRWILWTGLVGSAVLTLAMAFQFRQQWMLITLVFLMGLSYSALTATALNGLGVIYSPTSNPGILPGLNSTMFNFGASVGIGILASVLGAAPSPETYQQAFTIAAVLSVLALVASLALPGRRGVGERV